MAMSSVMSEAGAVGWLCYAVQQVTFSSKKMKQKGHWIELWNWVKTTLKWASKLWCESREIYLHYWMTESKNACSTPSYGNKHKEHELNNHIHTADGYLVQSPVASWHPPGQRTGPVWSWSQRSGCSPGAGSSPAWLTALTSEPPCPSHSLCTSVTPARDRNRKRKWSGEKWNIATTVCVMSYCVKWL